MMSKKTLANTHTTDSLELDATWVDTGVNLLDPRLRSSDVLSRAQSAQVNHLLVISSTVDESIGSVELCRTHNLGLHVNSEQTIYDTSSLQLVCTAGIHPHHADTYSQLHQQQSKSESWAKLKQLCADKNVKAVGECGLDFNRNFSSQENQLHVFEQQLIMASELGMGVYLHERDAFDAQYHLLLKYRERLKFMVVHCFTGTLSQMQKYLDLGCYIGITGWLCDSKRGQDLQEASKHLPLSRLLLETDAPYLFPKTLRPRQSTNEPCNIPYIGRFLAALRDEPEHVIKDAAFNNAMQLFFDARSRTQ